MRSKVIDEKNLNDEILQKVKKMVRNIRRRHTFIAAQSDLIEKEKAELVGISKDVFSKDMDADPVPDVYGNHEYHTDGGTVRVNFRVASSKLTEINGQPAPAYLKGELGDEGYLKLFDEEQSFTVTGGLDDFRTQAGTAPELFNVKLKEDITPAELMVLVQTHPDMFTLGVKDVEAYAKKFPGSVKATVAARIKNKFLDLVGDLNGNILVQARDYLKELVSTNMIPAVVVGNTSQAASKKSKKKKS